MVIGDDARYLVKGSGTTSLKLDSGISLQLCDILFVPSIKRNLISISALKDKGLQIAFSEGKVLAWSKKSNFKTARVIGNRCDSLYKLAANPIQALIHEAPESCELWHRRLGHLHFQALPTLGKMVKGMPKLSLSHDDACKGCAMGKNVKNPFHKSDSRAKEKLELIHSDLCGPMSVASPSGFLYYVSS